MSTSELEVEQLRMEVQVLRAELAECQKDSHPAVGSLVARNSELSEELDAAKKEIAELNEALDYWYRVGEEG